MEPGVSLDKVISTALSLEHFAQLCVQHVQLVLGFCPQGCRSPALQMTSVASLSHRIIQQLLQLLLQIQPWLLAQPGPICIPLASSPPRPPLWTCHLWKPGVSQPPLFWAPFLSSVVTVMPRTC